MNQQIVELEEGWAQIDDGVIQRLHAFLDGSQFQKFDNKDYMTYFMLVYSMCTQKPPHNYSEHLYQRYVQTIEQTFEQKVLPKIEGASDTEMSSVVQEQWESFRVFVRWMGNVFSYLDRFHTTRQGMPKLKEIGHNVFKDGIRSYVSEDIMSLLEDDGE